MITTSTILFFLLSLTVLFLYRLTRAGYKSIFFFNNNFNKNDNYDLAENIRVVQVCLGLCFFIYHSIIFFGILNTSLFFFASFIISLISEIISVKKGIVFGKYNYNFDLCPGPAISNIPILIALSWTGLIYMALICSMLILDVKIISDISILHILLTSFFITILDLVLDPIAVDEGRWFWDEPGKYYGVPLKNFIGWFFNTTLVLLVFSFLSFEHSITNVYPNYFTFAPAILFIILPLIAARPCFERNLNIAAIIGVLFTLALIIISYRKFL